MKSSWTRGSRPIYFRRRQLASAAVVVMVAIAGCGSSSKATTTSSTPSTSAPSSTATSVPAPTTLPQGSGPVNVLYAGSLVAVMTKQLGPAFDAATGYSFTGFSAGSDALATEIKGKTQAGDVFVSASPKVDVSLEGAANGNWVSWYATFATSKLVLGYNPSSKFASQLKTEPWYKVIDQPGFLLGRTDPATDPKGKLAVEALNTASTTFSQPALVPLATSISNVFPEETLVGRLQAGQLDAGFFYTAEASAAGIVTVPLTGTHLKATYTVTVLNQAAHSAGSEAFVDYMLSSAGKAALKGDGFELVSPPKVSGTGVPTSLSSLLPTS